MDLKSWYWFNNLQMARQKSMAFLDAYEECFSRFRGTAVTLWEIGTGYPKSKQPAGCMGMGGSLYMLKDFLGANATIVGIDMIDDCKVYENTDKNIHIEIGSQTDESFLKKLLDRYGCPDIVIDDGSHIDEDISATFSFLYPHLSTPGIYAIEDCFANHIIGNSQYDRDFHDERRFCKKALDMCLKLISSTLEEMMRLNLGFPIALKNVPPLAL